MRNVLTKPPGPFQWDARVRHRDGNYSWVENTASNLLFEGEVQAILMHQRDIDARRAREADRQQHAGEIMNGNLRVEEFAYTAAQDLREPLEAISAFAERLMGQTEIDESAKQTARLIVDGVARMSALVDDLLGIAKASGATATGRSLPAVLVNEIHLVRFRRNLTSKAVKQRGAPTGDYS